MEQVLEKDLLNDFKNERDKVGDEVKKRCKVKGKQGYLSVSLRIKTC